MLTIQEQQYFKSLIDTYKSKGYNYYLLHSDRSFSNYDLDYDYSIYFSKKEISAETHNKFLIDEGIKIDLDTSNRNLNNNNNKNYSISEFSGIIDIHTAEFVYTNSAVNYSLVTEVLNPDITYGGGVNYEQQTYFEVFSYIFVIAFLLAFFIHLFK